MLLAIDTSTPIGSVALRLLTDHGKFLDAFDKLCQEVLTPAEYACLSDTQKIHRLRELLGQNGRFGV